MKRLCSSILMVAAAAYTATAIADDVPSSQNMSEHQLMKECMAKQKASEGGMPREQMKKSCKDLAKTERENEKAEDTDAQQAQPASDK